MDPLVQFYILGGLVLILLALVGLLAKKQG